MRWVISISALRRWWLVMVGVGRSIISAPHPCCTPQLTAGHVWVAVSIKGPGHIKLAWLAEDWWIGKWGVCRVWSVTLSPAAGTFLTEQMLLFLLSSIKDRWVFFSAPPSLFGRWCSCREIGETWIVAPWGATHAHTVLWGLSWYQKV